MMKNKVSILMGIYNCADTLPEALESMITQTYTNWEIILCDDGSADNTYAVAEMYQEKYPDKIILLKNESNQGLNDTLNRCLEHAQGEYIARMDGDDISLTQRLEEEVKFLNAHPEYDIVSTPMIYFDEHGDWGCGTAVEYPDKEHFVSGTPFCHAPCMVRREAILAVGGYSEDRRTLRAEDYDLWFRMYANGSKGHNLTKPYYKMRDDQNAYKRRKFRYCLNEAYVRYAGYRRLHLPLSCYIYVLRPIVVGLLPKSVYRYLHYHKNS